MRILRVAKVLEKSFKGKNVVCFTHAASVALVSALLREPMPLDKSYKFAPCGIYWLEKKNDGPWRMVASGDKNPHVTRNDPNTPPWGFESDHIDAWNSLLKRDTESQGNIDS